MLVLGLAFVLVLGGGGYLAWRLMTREPPTPVVSPAISQEAIAAPTVTPAPAKPPPILITAPEPPPEVKREPPPPPPPPVVMAPAPPLPAIPPPPSPSPPPTAPTVAVAAPPPPAPPVVVVAPVPEPPPSPVVAPVPEPPPPPVAAADPPPPPPAPEPAVVVAAADPNAPPVPPTPSPEPPRDQADWLKDAKAGCAMWVPAWMRSPPYILKWSGPCRNGRAEGEGEATLLVHPQDHSPKTLKGRFQDGVFVGARPIPFPFSRLPGNDFLVALGDGGVTGAELWLQQRFGNDGGLTLCDDYAPQVLAVAPPSLSAIDEPAMKSFLAAAARAGLAACPKSRRAQVTVVSWDYRRRVDTNRSVFEPVLASAEVEPSEREPRLSGYRNDQAEAETRRQRAEQQRARQREREARTAETRIAFDRFAAENGVTRWVKPEQIDFNPFRWQQTVVAFRAQLVRMLSATTALATGEGGAMLVVAGVPPDLLDGSKAMIVAARVSGRRPATLTDSAGVARVAELLHVDLVRAYRCAAPGCGELLGWIGPDPNRFPWGGDPASFPKSD